MCIMIACSRCNGLENPTVYAEWAEWHLYWKTEYKYEYMSLGKYYYMVNKPINKWIVLYTTEYHLSLKSKR